MGESTVRKSVFNGSFYPGTAAEIKKAISSLDTRSSEPGRSPHPPVVMVPHAGWIYSGLAAVRGISTLKAANPRRIVLIGPSHRHHFEGFSPEGVSGYATPLGQIKVDLELQEKLVRLTGFRFEPDAHKFEHSLEVNIPVIQELLSGDIRILPILAGNVQEEDTEKLTDALSELLDPASDAVLISTDLSHFYSYEEARKLDKETLEYILNGDIEKLIQRSGQGGRLCCGFTGVVSGIKLANRWQLKFPELLMYYNSGDSGGDKQSVVGYASVAWFHSNPKKANGTLEAN